MGNIVVKAWKPNIPEERKKKFKEYVDDILSSGVLTNGKYCRAFEKEICKGFGVKYAKVVANGSIAIEAGLSYFRDVKKVKTVITQAYSFKTDWMVPLRLGMNTIIADVKDGQAVISPEQIKHILNNIDGNVVIMPVWMHGWYSRSMEEKINDIASENSNATREVYIFNDFAQCIGSAVNPLNSGLTSFVATKLLTAGEGGAVITNDEEMNEWIEHAIDIGQYGVRAKISGNNWRLSEFNAAFGLSGVPFFYNDLGAAILYWNIYEKRLSGLKSLKIFKPTGKDYSFNGYQCRVDVLKHYRDWWETRLLNDYGIETWISTMRYVPSDEPAFNGEAIFSERSKEMVRKGIYLPLYPSIRSSDVDYVVNALEELDKRVEE